MIEESKKSDYSIIRCDRSGVFFGKVTSLKGKTAKIDDARQIWAWRGAFNVMDIAKKGLDQGSSKVTVSADIVVTDAIQIIRCTKASEDCLKGTKKWTF